MTTEALTLFFRWMTLLNVGIMVVAALLCAMMKNFIAAVHGRMFGISPEALKITLYAWLGIYKIMVVVFCLTPWLALEIMT